MLIETFARYRGRCATCRLPVKPGHRIAFDPVTRRTYHVEHAPEAPAVKERGVLRCRN